MVKVEENAAIVVLVLVTKSVEGITNISFFPLSRVSERSKRGRKVVGRKDEYGRESAFSDPVFRARSCVLVWSR